MQNELILLRNNYPDGCQSYFNEYKRLEEDMIIVISHQSEESKANLGVDSLNAKFRDLFKNFKYDFKLFKMYKKTLEQLENRLLATT